MSQTDRIIVVDEGLTDYRTIWDKQLGLMQHICGNKKNGVPTGNEWILLTEHKPVITLGRHGKASNLICPPEILEKKGIECIQIERGGDITFHGPGQLVVYPILDLELHSMGIKAYINFLEQSVISLLAAFGIKGEIVDDAPGVWIDPGTGRDRKICAIGVKSSRYVTMHGLAINVNTDLDYFSLINPCGFVDKGVTSISRELRHPVDMQLVKDRLIEIMLARLKR